MTSSSASETYDDDRSLVQALNTHINDEDQYEDIKVIDLENVITTSSGSSASPTSMPERTTSPLRSSDGSSLRSSTGSSSVASAAAKKRNVVIPPEAKEDVVIISNNDTTVLEEEEEKSSVPSDMSHVSVVVVGGSSDDQNSVKVQDSSATSHTGGIESNGGGELSDLSRSFSSASHTSSEISSSSGAKAISRAAAVTSPTSIILEGSTVTATDTDETFRVPEGDEVKENIAKPQQQTAPRRTSDVSPTPQGPNNGHAVSPVSESSEEDSGIQSKSVEEDHSEVMRKSTISNFPPTTTTSKEKSSSPQKKKKTQRAMSEQIHSTSHKLQSSELYQAEEEEEVELRKKRQIPDVDYDVDDDSNRTPPPVVPVLRRKEEVVVGSAVARKTPLTKEDIAKMNLKRKTRKRTRKFEIDGVVVTTTTSKVIYGDDENERFYDDHYFRKQELRELKLLQKQEQKQFQDLAFKNQVSANVRGIVCFAILMLDYFRFVENSKRSVLTKSEHFS